MASNSARTRRNTTNLYEASVALRHLRQHMPEAELCAALGCNGENLKRWAYMGVPGRSSSAVVALWHKFMQTPAA
jgi:hypothetical protein